MSSTKCLVCQNSKAPFQCGICHEHLCKNCTQFVEDNSFSLLSYIPVHLQHTTYCGPCFDARVAPTLETYNQTMEKARDVNVYFKTQGKETRTFKRKHEALKVEECDDRDEALLKLAFLAAKANFNTLIDVNLTSKKEIINGYQRSIWSATGIPMNAEDRNFKRKKE